MRNSIESRTLRLRKQAALLSTIINFVEGKYVISSTRKNLNTLNIDQLKTLRGKTLRKLDVLEEELREYEELMDLEGDGPDYLYWGVKD